MDHVWAQEGLRSVDEAGDSGEGDGERGLESGGGVEMLDVVAEGPLDRVWFAGHHWECQVGGDHHLPRWSDHCGEAGCKDFGMIRR